MTILKTIDGQEINSDDFKGYGQLKKYVQENIDPLFGTGSKEKFTTWEVELSATKTVNLYETVEVEAATKDAAEKIGGILLIGEYCHCHVQELSAQSGEYRCKCLVAHSLFVSLLCKRRML